MALKKHQKVLPPDIQSGPCILYNNRMEKNFLLRVAKECGYVFSEEQGDGLLAFHGGNSSAILIITTIAKKDANKLNKIKLMSFKEGICFLDDILKFQSPELWYLGRNFVGKTVPNEDGEVQKVPRRRKS